MRAGIKKNVSTGEQWMKDLGDSHVLPGAILLVILLFASVHRQITLHKSTQRKKTKDD